MSNFITNSEQKNLKDRLQHLIPVSDEIKILVGFCYFSGFMPIYDALKNNNNLKLKLLIGLALKNIDKSIIETSHNSDASNNEIFQNFLNSYQLYFKDSSSDDETVYNNAKLFIKLIEEGRLDIRKTRKPNHSKLYLFDFNASQVSANRSLITGSSNLTRSGLESQDEFNVEIRDYGFDEASNYFNTLWKDSIKITEDEENKKMFIDTLLNKTHLRQISPFEAYCFVIKNYLDTFRYNDGDININKLFGEKYKPYSYQTDAIKMAFSIVKNFNGVLIADVVGLGKSIIASIVAKMLKKRGIVLCPPGLIGDAKKNSGWKMYLKDFRLNDWEVYSIGDLDTVINNVEQEKDFEVVIIDEVHRFRNENTQTYEKLKRICNGKKVIALTATPFNNKPNDLLTILKLFVNPRKSNITLDDNLDLEFKKINSEFKELHYIKKYMKDPSEAKQKKVKNYVNKIFSTDTIPHSNIIDKRIKTLANKVKNIIEPITIRRNRKDLMLLYREEVDQLSKVKNPEPAFFELDYAQNKFYDEIIQIFDGSNHSGTFTGAIYRPAFYIKGTPDAYDIDEYDIDDVDDNEQKSTPDEITQSNLFRIIRGLLVRRFESSFGAFKKSLENFRDLYGKILQLIEEKNIYIFHKNTLEKILELMYDDESDLSPDETDQEIKKIINELTFNLKDKRRQTVYYLDDFAEKEKFIDDIKNDINLLNSIINKIDQLNLIENDPKSYTLFKILNEKFQAIPHRKIIIFSEYVDTVRFLEQKLSQHNPQLYNRTLFVYGNISKSMHEEIIQNFDASSEIQVDDYDLIIATDKLSEGYNLNRAGVVINYDIPWNPVRVIQRVGRINRISKKVFDELEIVNFFPTEKGSQIAKAKEIASTKMFMIHNILGEDVKIFDPDEEPTPSGLFDRLNQNPEEAEDESLYTKLYNEFEKIKKEHPDILERIYSFPSRVKVIKESSSNDLTVVYRKGRLFLQHFDIIDGKLQLKELSFEEILDKIKASPSQKSLQFDENFWDLYNQAFEKDNKLSPKPIIFKNSKQALNNLIFINKNFSSLPNDLNSLVENLINDILNYGSLSEFTINSIANINLKNVNDLQNELEDIKTRLGNDYFKNIEQNFTETTEKEIIVSIMNKNLEAL